MDALIILLVGYVILKSIFSGGSDYDYDKKPERRQKKEVFLLGRHSHIFRIRHMEPLAWG